MKRFNFYIHGFGKPFRRCEEADFILHESVWDDYGYKTTYSIVASHVILNSKNDEEIGHICITKVGQGMGKNILSDVLVNEDVIDELPSEFVSFIRDVKIVDNLFCILDQEERDSFRKSMHIIVDENEYYQLVKRDDCFNTSLLRSYNREKFLETTAYVRNVLCAEINGKAIVESYMKNVKRI